MCWDFQFGTRMGFGECVCVCWELPFGERNRFGERLYLLQEVGSFDLKEDHNATWK